MSGHRRPALTHPRGCGFRFDKRRKVIYHVATKQVVPGLTSKTRGLQAFFYPHYSFSKATIDAEVSRTFQSEAGAPSGYQRGGSRSRFMRRGNLLDAQMGRTLMYFKRLKLPHQYFFDAATRATWTKTVVPPLIRRYCAGILPYAKACWKTFFERGLFPVAHQVVVGCTRMQRGTLLDMVCQDTAGRYVVVEFKAGFQSYYYKCTGKNMLAPFQLQTDCVFNQHQLQLLFNAELYRRSYFPTASQRSCLGTPLLIRFRHEDEQRVAADVHALRPWAASNTAAACARMTAA